MRMQSGARPILTAALAIGMGTVGLAQQRQAATQKIYLGKIK